ncbi:MAG TPA: hypothetical protein VMT69_05015 [Kineosporiaceae bacterium]|nr:hypothetical protein [Kineosporiaceae bacterium]
MRRRELLRSGLLAGLGGGLLAACSQAETGTPAVAPPHPAVLPGQAEHVLAEVDAALARAFPAANPRLLGTRVVGPASRDLTARLSVAAARKHPLTPPGPMTLRRLVLPAPSGWPRWFLAAGTLPGEPTPVLRVLRSVSPRDPYGLWGELSLLPGASLPDLASPQTGTPLIDPADGKGLVDSPSGVVAGYAAALMAGTTDADGFAPDQFRQQVAGQTAADRRILGAVGTAVVDNVHRPSSDGVLALRTQDGGALVVAALEQLYQIRVQPGQGLVKLDADLAALAGVPQIGHRLRRTSVEVLAFQVPPSGGGKVSVIAASKADTSAVGS